MRFGIGRLPQDVDQAKEDAAALAAQKRYPTRPVRNGERVAPSGTTEGEWTGEACEVCGRPGGWNPGAGQTLCPRHWDEY